MNDLDIVLCSAADVQRWVGNMWDGPFCHAMTRIELLRPALFAHLTTLWEPYLRELQHRGGGYSIGTAINTRAPDTTNDK